MTTIGVYYKKDIYRIVDDELRDTGIDDERVIQATRDYGVEWTEGDSGISIDDIKFAANVFATGYERGLNSKRENKSILHPLRI
jgi:hypothetical protein